MFVVRVETVAGIALCRFAGEVDMATCGEVRAVLAALTAQRRVVLDFSDVAFIDSAGLGCLIAGARRIHAADGDVVLASPRPAVHRLLMIVGMDRVMPMADTVDDARSLLDRAADVARDPLRHAPPLLRV